MAYLTPHGDPVDERHPFDVAKEYYDHPLRDQNARLIKELSLCKAALRAAGIDTTKLATGNKALSKGKAPALRMSLRHKQPTSKLPHIPTEILLKIMTFGLMSKHPIIDPLSKVNPDNLTAKENLIVKDQIAIGFLTVSKIFHEVGKKVLWGNNTFVFTSPTALRNFGILALEHRQRIETVNLRPIAKLYDVKKRKHFMSSNYSLALDEKVRLRVQHPPPPVEAMYGVCVPIFQTYAWSQLVDFLRALQPSHVVGSTIADQRPYLFPNLSSMRIDLVNFQGSPSEIRDVMHEIHVEAHHRLPASLNELMVTGLPCGAIGSTVGKNLATMLKIDGLFLDGQASYIQTRASLKPLKGPKMNAKVHRSRVALLSDDDDDDHDHHMHPAAVTGGPTPYVPDGQGHPDESTSALGRETVWKYIPVARDSSEREWVEFDRQVGFRTEYVEDILNSFFADSDGEMDFDLLDDFDPEEEIDMVSGEMPCAKCEGTACDEPDF